ncbi:hypothetical protein RAMLITH_13580 [Ramlibacter sp. RBP-2]|uniref:Uncharacterized protein n=1 Tax=Ramlibacter lithotrophicus TaxID=2606681 RepID=A0A7X6DGR1_9BURK|nr:hypothetical protein [Ramlibacter lithotrophicus]NKE66855.1 hypothetical protein [Ramlibacter lithotrophicus]
MKHATTGVDAPAQLSTGAAFRHLCAQLHEQCRQGYWRHSPRILLDAWLGAGGEWTKDDAPEQRLVGRSRNTYLFLEEKQAAKNISHIMNGRVLFTPEIGRALATSMFTYWHYDEASSGLEKRKPIKGCSDPSACASEIIDLIFQFAKAEKGFHVSRLPVQEGGWDDFANSLAEFDFIYVLSRYRSIRGVGRDDALTEMVKDGQGKLSSLAIGVRTSLALFAGEGGALSVLLQKTRQREPHRRTICVWVCDYGLQHNEDSSDWLAHWNFADLRAGFAAFLHAHARDFKELVKDAHDRCRFVVKNSPTLAVKREELFRDSPYVQALSASSRLEKVDPLPEAMPDEWKPLLTGPRGQVLRHFPQTLLAGADGKGFRYFYFPSEHDTFSTLETVLIESQPIHLTSSLGLVSDALHRSAGLEPASEAEKQLRYLNWDILKLDELMSL